MKGSRAQGIIGPVAGGSTFQITEDMVQRYGRLKKQKSLLQPVLHVAGTPYGQLKDAPSPSSLSTSNVASSFPVDVTSGSNELRCRYGNTLHWYTFLHQLAFTRVDDVISLARGDILTVDTPSQYLWSRCPLCFGGKVCHDESAV